MWHHAWSTSACKWPGEEGVNVTMAVMMGMLVGCYGRNVCVSWKFIRYDPNHQWDGSKR